MLVSKKVPRPSLPIIDTSFATGVLIKMDNRPSIRSFRDLQVYQNSYQAMMVVMTKIIPRLPRAEKFDLVDQTSRSCKAIPRLIAEGYAKKHQKLGFQKYLDDAMAESNETQVSLEQCRDIYKIEENY